MNNFKKIINTHIMEVIRKFYDQFDTNNNNSNNCNCKTKVNCPVNGLCNLKNIVYQAIIFIKENIKDKKTYTGILSVRWKLRYSNHIDSFYHEHLCNQTALSKHFWKLKNKGLTPEILWRLLKRSSTLSCFDGRCNLCLEEKIQIILYSDPGNLLNQMWFSS